MSDLDKLREELDKYYKLKESLEVVVLHLELTIEKLHPLISNLYYEINELKADKNAVLKQRNEIIDKKDRIKQLILPETDQIIHYLKNKIQQEEILLNNMGV